MAKAAKQKITKVDVVDEPEIQYAATPELMDEIKLWLEERGGDKKKAERDSAVYYDTRNFRLLREGIEYRIKEKGDGYRHDMKTPADTHNREVVPDENNIVRRKEIKFKTDAEKPTLKAFFGQAILAPVVDRVYRFFEKELMAKFRSSFFKEKYDYDTSCERSRVEYSFQTGHMMTADGARKTDLLHIVELELREGLEEGLLEEKAELERVFLPKGLEPLQDRKVILGFELLVPDMDAKQRHAYEDAKKRNRKVCAADNDTAPSPKIQAAA